MSLPRDSGDRAASANVGEQLAEWLEGLGLADQLAAAGLPTYDRDAGRRARGATRRPANRCPTTGSPSSTQRSGRSATTRPTPSRWSSSGSVARAGLGRRSSTDGWVDYAAVGRLRGVSENAARFALHKAAERRAVLLVPHDGATLVPSFQLDPQGQVRDELLTVLEPLMAAGVDPWRTWIWLTSPAALLGGAVPHEAARDPEEQPLVQRAAVALAERARAAGR